MSLSETLSALKRIPNSAVNIIDIQQKNNMVYTGSSKIVKDQNGLFASRDIKKGEKVVIYFGDILTKEEFLTRYKENKNIMKYIRKGSSFWIDGRYVYKVFNKNMFGAYVNDISKPLNISKKSVNKYIKTMRNCNLVSVDTGDFPIYVASKDIKAGTELSVHYGIGYWLLYMGMSPNMIDKKYKKLIKRTYR